MREGIQDVFGMMGRGGCLLFAIMRYCQVMFDWKGDIVNAIFDVIDRKLVSYEKDNPKSAMGGYVYNSVAIIKLLTGIDVVEERIDVNGRRKNAEPNHINWWQLPNSHLSEGHFTFGDWNSLEESVNVKDGYVKQIRRYREVGKRN